MGYRFWLRTEEICHALNRVLYVELFNGDTKLFVGYEDGTARIWDTNSAQSVRTFDGHVAVLAHDYLYGAPFAISRDGRTVLTANKDGGAHIWDAATGAEKATVSATLGNIGYARFSPSVPIVLIAGSDGTATFDLNTGQQLWRIQGDSDAVQFSKTGTVALTSGNDGVHFRDSASGALLYTVPLASAFDISLSPDGNTLIGGTFTSGASVWDVHSSKKLWDVPNSYGGDIDSAISVAISPDGRTFASALIDRRMGSWDSEVHVFSRDNFNQIASLRGTTARLLSIGFIGLSPYILGTDQAGDALLWRAESKSVRYSGHIAPVITGAVSPDGHQVILGSLDQSVSLWKIDGDERFHFTGHTQYIGSTSFSHDSKYAFSTGGAGYKWSVETGQRLAQFGASDLGRAVILLFSTADDNYVFTQAFDRTLLWTTTGKEVVLPEELKSPPDGERAHVTFSPDGKIATVKCNDASKAKLPKTIFGTLLVCDASYRGVVRGLSKDGSWVMSSEGAIAYLQKGDTVLSFNQEHGLDLMTLSDDNSLLLTGSLQDDIVHLWSTVTKAELCRMVLMKSGNWVIFDSDGRFDTDDVEGTHGLNWTMPATPLRPLALELFMRDYFTPGLMARKLDGSIRNVAGIANRDTATPELEIQDLKLDSSLRTVQVKIKVSGSRSANSGHAYDLRVFRNGQLVATVPENGGLLDPHLVDQTITIPDIQIPSLAAGGEIEFSAYAFNRDGIKGRTAKRLLQLHASGRKTSGVAYLVTFGVNTFDDPRWDLQFAANDARQLSTDAYESLVKTSQFASVIRTALISDKSQHPGEAAATKMNLQSALLTLSGREPVSATLPFHLKRATPDDMVLIHIATHGYTDESGTFYVLPSDIGPDAGSSLSTKLRAKSISSDDLMSWLANIDAGEIILILDTCQAAAIAGRNFKPAPMDDRNFGQLVYDKKIRLLVGTQSDSVALEVDQLQHGLLTYSLAHDGLELKRADFNPLDHSITLSEWFRYALTHVPELETSIVAGREIDTGVVIKRANIFDVNSQDRLPIAQRPVVFDFGSRTGPVLWGQPFFDPSLARDGGNIDEAEFKAAADISDPVASAAALKRFIAKHRPGAATAAAWPYVTANLIEARAPSSDLISAARLSLSHLSLIGDAETAATAAAVLISVADQLERRHDFSDVAHEFRDTAARIKSQIKK